MTLLHRTAPLGALLIPVALLVGCTSTSSEPSAADTLAELRDEATAGTGCSELFAIFEQIDEQVEEFAHAKGEMVAVGCGTRNSERYDGGDPGSASIDDLTSKWFGVHGTYATPSEQCASAASTAAAEPDATAAESLIAATLDACTSVDEWMSSLQDFPGMMGLTDGYVPIVMDVQSACYSYPDTRVCADAASLGIEVGP